MRPAENHTLSPSSAPHNAANSTCAKDSRPLATAEPANTSNGADGSGTPRRVRRTFANTAALPHCTIADGGIWINRHLSIAGCDAPTETSFGPGLDEHHRNVSTSGAARNFDAAPGRTLAVIERHRIDAPVRPQHVERPRRTPQAFV